MKTKMERKTRNKIMPNFVAVVALVVALALATPTRQFVYSADAFAFTCICTFAPTLTKTKTKSATSLSTLAPKETFSTTWSAANHAKFSSFLSSSPSSSQIITSTRSTDATKSDPDTNNSNNNNNNNDDDSNPPNYLVFVRPALLVDMNRASKILADGFFKGPQTNWITYQYEKLVTYLSLEANFPKSQRQRSRYEIFVACDVDTGNVVGMVEIDARGTADERTSKVYEQSGGSAYMCNLAVDEKQRRKGIATSLVDECERQIQDWYNEDQRKGRQNEKSMNTNTNAINLKQDIIFDPKNEISSSGIVGNSNETNQKKNQNKMSNSVCLKVRESDIAAVQMYRKLGYLTVSKEIPENPNKNKMKGNILLMRKQLSTASISPPSST
uniref:N-acetyltransferase domain-containing protein n=1 Tax=Pseudo-nitzschia australis TaxID=44445 RepID=A0A7S4AL51_9STRA